MRRREIPIAAVVGAAFAVACLDMSAPKGPASISLLILPSSSIVVNDVMRDSLGNPAPLSVNAFDATGNLIPNVTRTFFITDSAPVATFIAPGVLRGDTLGTVHVVGQANGVQTPVAAIPVTVAPASLAPVSLATTVSDTTYIRLDTVVVTGDTSKHVSVPLAVVLAGVNPGTFSQKFIIRYVLLAAPGTSPTATSPAVFLADDQGSPRTAASTDASGQAHLNLVVTPANLGDTALISGQRVDTAIVTASTSYKGVPVAGSPVIFAVPIIATTRAPSSARGARRTRTIHD